MMSVGGMVGVNSSKQNDAPQHKVNREPGDPVSAWEFDEVAMYAPQFDLQQVWMDEALTHSLMDWLVWVGLVWFGVGWFGLVWFGLVWCGLVWFGLVWFVDMYGGSAKGSALWEMIVVARINLLVFISCLVRNMN
jgi:hypothetical protein